jgi:HK97 family phage prohead protease
MVYDPRLGYEIAAQHHCGYEVASGGGFITQIDHQSVTSIKEIAFTDDGKVLQGFACFYNKPIFHEGKFQVIAPGAFDAYLANPIKPVEFWLKHDEQKVVGDTNSGLELYSDQRGLAFRFRFPNTTLGREARQLARDREYTGVSVGCTFKSNIEIIDGEPVMIIQNAHLQEISLVPVGAIGKAFAILGTPDETLQEYCSTSLASDGAFVGLQRALRKLIIN